MTQPNIKDRVNDQRSQAVAEVINGVCERLDRLGWSALYTDMPFVIQGASARGEFFYCNGEEIEISLDHFYLCRIDFLVVRSLAEGWWARRLDNTARFMWIMKMVTADPVVVGRVQDAMRNCTTFEAIIESMADAPSKLVAIHLCNALTAHNVRYPTASMVNLLEHPATREMASGVIPFSLIPLTSVYSSKDHMKFPQAVAHKAITGSVPVTEDGTRRAVENLIDISLAA